MRKDKADISSVSPIAGDPKASSTQVLKELGKEAEKKEPAAGGARTLCKICFREVAPKRVCGGHSGGRGGSSGGSGASEEKASQSSQSLARKPEARIDEARIADDFSFVGKNLDSQLQSDEESFNPEIMAGLVADELLVIDNDRESMTLSIKLKCEPNLLSEEQRHELKKFMAAILKEFNEFKKINHLSDNCVSITQDKEGNIISLRISLPTLALYDAFIQRLANNLLPTQNPELQAKNEIKSDQGFVRNPFSMEPKPSNKDLTPQKAEDEKQERFHPSPFSIKPKGC